MVNALHLLLTYQCTRSCPHCFVWGRPGCSPTMSVSEVMRLVTKAQRCGIRKISFEGGEPFVVYPLLKRGVRAVQRRDLQVSVVTNGYWATSIEDARKWLVPLAELGPLTIMISTDDYHGGDLEAQRAGHAVTAAQELGVEVIVNETTIKQVMFRGRAAQELAHMQTAGSCWKEFDQCPHESLDAPDRVHLDPMGYLHVCQGVCVGQVIRPQQLGALLSSDMRNHPILRQLASGGPAGLLRQFGLPLQGKFIDACHLCYTARQYMRNERQFPQYLAPGWVYGENEA